MASIEQQITINAPVERVYSYLADFPRHPEWAAHPLTLQAATPGPLALGSKFHSVGHMMGKDCHDQVTITELTPNQRIGFEVIDGPNLLRHRFTMRTDGEGTVVTKSMEPLKAGFPFVVIGPILAITGVLAKGLQGDLTRIKERVEGGKA